MIPEKPGKTSNEKQLTFCLSERNHRLSSSGSYGSKQAFKKAIDADSAAPMVGLGSYNSPS
ncbi:MAG: hypothetical protein OEZ58_14940 [Gammaproteobacteria bacterium]|nr:hypothetical protein [Gammaproteobacteria bacterium]